MTLLPWLIVFTLIAVNALYVAAEFATVSVRPSQLRVLAGTGNRKAAALLPVVENIHHLDRYIAACQIGITFSSLALGAYGQSRLADQLAPLLANLGGMQMPAAQSLAAGIVLVGLTIAQVLLGELVPKSIALQYSSQTAILTALPMRWSQSAFAWFIAVLNGSGNGLLRLFGFSTETQRHIHSPQEIGLLLSESRKGGLLESEVHRRLQQGLRMSDRSARQLMVPRGRLAAIDIATSMPEVIRQLTESPFTRMPVYRGSLDNLLGILHIKDLLAHSLEKGEIATIEPLLRPIVYVPESLTADRLLARLREEKSQQAIVIDEFGGIEGLVTLEDILTGMLGEIADEFKGRRQPERLPDGRVRLPGRLPLEEAEAWTGVRWQGKSDTIGGRVIEVLGELPTVSLCVIVDGARVEVETVREHHIETLVVIPATTGGEEQP